MRQIRFMPARRHHEFAWHHLRALMDKLVERVLPVGSRLAPDHRARGAIHRFARHRHALAVALHFKLLKIRWQTRQPLIIGQHGAGRMSRRPDDAT